MEKGYLLHPYKMKYLKCVSLLFNRPAMGGFIFLSLHLLFCGEMDMSRGIDSQG